MTLMDRIDLAILRSVNVANSLNERYGIAKYIDSFVSELYPSDDIFLLEIIYPLSRLRSHGIKVIAKKFDAKNNVKFDNQILVNINKENLEILLNNIALKFDNVHIEKCHESL